MPRLVSPRCFPNEVSRLSKNRPLVQCSRGRSAVLMTGFAFVAIRSSALARRQPYPAENATAISGKGGMGGEEISRPCPPSVAASANVERNAAVGCLFGVHDIADID